MLHTTDSLAALESDEQRQALDIVTQLRKCGLESVLSLPQLVVCGDQSAGKSSVLEALTEIPFPRNDNLCTRFATEIILRRAPTNSLQIKVIPDPERPASEQENIRAFSEVITNFDELPYLMAKVTTLMGIDATADASRPRRAFAKDTLSMAIEGPQRPQLTVVDLPGIVQSETKDTSQEDVALVSEITEHYISQPRTICLAVVSATHDYANQEILSKVRKFDKEGERTLGIITKPDRLSPGSGSEEAFIDLANNQDIQFKLGWHVLKNRSFEETSFSFHERNASEAAFFRKSNFKVLAPETLGIKNLVTRISQLLFSHILQVLPNLQAETKEALEATLNELEQMGRPRVTGAECRTYLTQVGQDYSEVCKAAISGNYEGTFFLETIGASIIRSVPVRRLRAVVQLMNQDFSNTLRQKGHKFHLPQFGGKKPIRNQHSDLNLEPPSEEEIDGDVVDPRSPPDNKRLPFQNLFEGIARPTKLSRTRAKAWVQSHIIRSRGRELPGNFNPLVIGELFWEQSSRWHKIAETHTEQVGEICNQFLSDLLRDTTPKDVYTRLWSRVQDELALRSRNALAELRRLCEDLQNYPINYNHYYTDTITKRSNERERKELKSHLATHTTVKKMPGCQSDHTFESVNVDAALNGYFQNIDPDMDSHGCDAVLDCLFAIYKVNQKVFMANVTIQVIERHIVRDLDQILSAVVIAGLPDDEVQKLSSEPPSARKQREFLIDRREKLEEGRKVLRQVMRTPVAR
ncbi:hypothetical protein LOZ43_006839 [Ophidiomyces ophidiicola]|nr:hypothetical protein LOZ43_006839 [Ophidiomyces ophidiicola]